jgi:hypothetical protein
MRRTLVALLAGIAIGAAAVAAPALGSQHSKKGFIKVPVGNFVDMPGISLSCSLLRQSRPLHGLSGNLLFCSKSGNSYFTWSFEVSRSWIKVISPQNQVVYQHAR